MNTKSIILAVLVSACSSEVSAIGDCVTGVLNERSGLRVDLDSGIMYCNYARVYYQVDDSQITDVTTTWTGGFVSTDDFFGLFEFDYYYNKVRWGSGDKAVSTMLDRGQIFILGSIYGHLDGDIFPRFPGVLQFHYRTP